MPADLAFALGLLLGFLAAGGLAVCIALWISGIDREAAGEAAPR